MSDFPEPFVGSPLTSAECDCTDLDGFMLNVERLMASELVALGTHEEVAAALFLWCRAWKQIPAASLPDDDRVNAAFARLPLARFRKLKATVLRGFVKCSDGRLYHRVLAKEATAAFERKVAFRKKRENDAKRLREWRDGKRETQSETPPETDLKRRGNANETRFVAEGQGQGQGQGQGHNNLPAYLPIAEGGGAEKSELDLVEQACRQALGDNAPQTDFVIGPMVEAVRKFGQDRVSLTLASESRRPRRKPIRTWRIWAEIVSEALTETARAPPSASGEQPYSHRAAIEGAKAILREKAKASAQ